MSSLISGSVQLEVCGPVSVGLRGSARLWSEGPLVGDNGKVGQEVG